MTAAGAIARGRVAAERLMVDLCTVRYQTGVMTQDAATGAEAPVYAARFSSKCKVQARDLVSQANEAGGRQVVVVRLELHLPIGVADCKPGDIVEITSAGPGSNTVPGRKLRISGPVDKTFQTAVRYEVEEVVE